jgi:GntR family transcriptional repressor for pyruvate dehydrogenase complex
LKGFFHLCERQSQLEFTALEKIQKQKLSDAVVGELGRLIENGLLKTGDKLPCQSELAVRLGVSRNTLREALHSLTLVGILDQRQGSGTFVRCGLPGNLTAFLKPPDVNGPQRAVELVEARTLIEVANAQAASEHASADDRVELKRLCASMKAALHHSAHESFFKHDADFHHALAMSTGNPFMAHLFLIIRSLIEPLVRDSIRTSPRRLECFQADHERICNAVSARDQRSAAAEMARHMAHVREAVTVIHETDAGHRNGFYARRPDRAAERNPRRIAAPPDMQGGC